jgi:hypothetical protein
MKESIQSTQRLMTINTCPLVEGWLVASFCVAKASGVGWNMSRAGSYMMTDERLRSEEGKFDASAILCNLVRLKMLHSVYVLFKK